MGISFYIKKANRFNKNVTRFIGKSKLPFAWLSETYCFIKYGCSPDDYFRYEFYRKSGFERNRFITYRRSQQIIKKYNDPSKIHYFADKREFNKKFHSYINRDWLDLSKCSEQDLNDFFYKHGEILLKPLNGGQGRGIKKLISLDGFKLEEYRDYIAEEIIQQHEQMSTLNPSSVNTIRVMTFKGEVIACALRIGGENSLVDNLHSNGICAHIDKDSGVIDYLCIDNDYNKYLKHPATGKILVGFQIPNWNTLISKVKEATKIVPEVQYVGWDVAVLKNQIVLIEANHDPGHAVMQMSAQIGLWEDIKHLMR